MTETRADTTLLECPFCGAEAKLEDHRTIWVVACGGCKAVMLGERAPEPEGDGDGDDEYYSRFKQTAIDAWNRRDTDSGVAELKERVETAEASAAHWKAQFEHVNDYKAKAEREVSSLRIEVERLRAALVEIAQDAELTKLYKTNPLNPDWVSGVARTALEGERR